MKRLILIGGTMGVGKTAAGQALGQLLPKCAFLDGDWCWTWRQDCVNEETKSLVIHNIVYLLREYLHTQTYENIVFVWVMHQQSIWDEIVSGLSGEEFELHKFVLTACRDTFEERFLRDVQSGKRRRDAMDAAFARMEMYESIDAAEIATDGMNVDQVAQALLRTMENKA